MKIITMNNKNLLWLQKNGQYLKIDRIAKEIGIPGRTLKAFVDGDRPLADKWHEKVSNWVDAFKK